MVAPAAKREAVAHLQTTLGMAEQLADRRQRYAVHRGMAGKGVPQVV